MTQINHIARHAPRRVTALLLAAVAFPAIAQAQETVAPPVVTPPVVTVPVQSVPAPTVPAPAPAPAAQTPPGESPTRIAPGVAEQAAQETRERAASQRAQARPAAQPAARSQAARAAPVRAPVAAAPAVAEAAPVTPAPAAPVAADPAPATPPPVAETVPAPVEAAAETGNARLWLVLAGLGLAAAAIAAFLLLRRRREDDVDAEPAYAEPAYAAEPEPVAPAIAEPDPVAAAPLFTPQPATAPRHDAHPALEHATLSHADAEDIDAVLGGGTPHGDRPQLELAMRPTRAGLNRDDAVVEFELTVANAGGVAAEDVRIGAFMLSGETGERSQIEQLLINPPAELVVDAESIAPGDGTRLDAAITVPRDILSLHEDGDHSGFTPVLLADARYRLPDGSEGRTAAAFTIGRVNGGEALVPIGIEDAAMYDDIEARLHSVPAKV